MSDFVKLNVRPKWSFSCKGFDHFCDTDGEVMSTESSKSTGSGANGRRIISYDILVDPDA